MAAARDSMPTRERALEARQLTVLALVFSAIVLEGIDIQVIGLAAPSIIGAWAVTRAALGPAMAASLVGTAIGASAGGYGDRWGRRPLLTASVAAFGLMTLCTAFAGSVWQLALLRLAAGVGFGAALSNAPPLIAEWMPARMRGWVVAMMIVGVPVGGMLGAAAAGVIIPAFGWRAAFALAGVVPLLLAVAMLRWLPESPEFSARQPGDTATRSSSWAALFAVRARRTTFGLAIAFSANLAVSYAFFNWTPTLLTSLHMPLKVALNGLFYFNLCGALGTALAARFILRRGSKPGLLGLVTLGLGSTALLLVVMAMGVTSRQEVAVSWLMVGVSLAGVATVASQAALYALAAHAYPASCRATGIGFAGTVGRVGAILSALGGGVVLDWPSGVRLFIAAVAVLFAVSGLGTLIVDRHAPAT
jgi:MFS transporter, AAHS family, 4-hydroxybenzoate transporter